jgi:hypothetical protein
MTIRDYFTTIGKRKLRLKGIVGRIAEEDGLTGGKVLTWSKDDVQYVYDEATCVDPECNDTIVAALDAWLDQSADDDVLTWS